MLDSNFIPFVRRKLGGIFIRQASATANEQLEKIEITLKNNGVPYL